MELNDLTREVETYWAEPLGALYRLRNSETDWHELDRLVSILRAAAVPDEALLPRRLVAVLWYMPQFVEWQVERAPETEQFRVLQLAAAIRTELERILGVP